MVALSQAVLPRELVWAAGEQRCDFFSSDVSCFQAVRDAFRVAKSAAEIEEALDEAIAINKGVMERVHLLYTDDHEKTVLSFVEPQGVISFDEKYEQEKSKLPPSSTKELAKALDLIENATTVLKNTELDTADRARIAKACYRESIRLFPTADAHAYLGWHCFLDEDINGAVTECTRAIAVDPTFGNAYNDLALIRMHQGRHDEAVKLFVEAKMAARNDVRHFACLNLAKLHLENDRVKLALHQYIEALHWMQPHEWDPIRNTVTDISTYIVTVSEKLGSVQ